MSLDGDSCSQVSDEMELSPAHSFIRISPSRSKSEIERCSSGVSGAHSAASKQTVKSMTRSVAEKFDRKARERRVRETVDARIAEANALARDQKYSEAMDNYRYVKGLLLPHCPISMALEENVKNTQELGGKPSPSFTKIKLAAVKLWALRQNADVSFIMGKLQEQQFNDYKAAARSYKQAYTLYTQLGIASAALHNEEYELHADLKTVLVMQVMASMTCHKYRDFPLSAKLYESALEFLKNSKARTIANCEREIQDGEAPPDPAVMEGKIAQWEYVERLLKDEYEKANEVIDAAAMESDPAYPQIHPLEDWCLDTVFGCGPRSVIHYNRLKKGSSGAKNKSREMSELPPKSPSKASRSSSSSSSSRRGRSKSPKSHHTSARRASEIKAKEEALELLQQKERELEALRRQTRQDEEHPPVSTERRRSTSVLRTSSYKVASPPSEEERSPAASHKEEQASPSLKKVVKKLGLPVKKGSKLTATGATSKKRPDKEEMEHIGICTTYSMTQSVGGRETIMSISGDEIEIQPSVELLL